MSLNLIYNVVGNACDKSYNLNQCIYVNNYKLMIDPEGSLGASKPACSFHSPIQAVDLNL